MTSPAWNAWREIGGGGRNRPRHIEEHMQESLVAWFGLQYPEYALLLHHSPNGGKRSAEEGRRFKLMGTRAGFPDLILLMPRHGYAYLCIELKTDKGRQSDTQRAYQHAVEANGGRYEVVRDFDTFRTLIQDYLHD